MLMEHPSESVQHFLLVFVTVLHSVAFATTCLRLWVRLRLRRFLWEDGWAFLALCFNVMCAVSTWTLTLPERDHPWYMTHESHIVSVWLQLVAYTCLKWAAKISIMFSLMRMVDPSSRIRGMTNAFTICFFVLWALCIASKLYDCGVNRSWYSLVNPQCTFGLPVAVIEFVASVVSDVILLVLPIHLIYQMKPPRNERILILSIFSMSLLSVLVSIVHLTFLIPRMGFMASMTADIEGAVDLMNCDLLVLVTSLYRFFGNGRDFESRRRVYDLHPELSTLRTSDPTLTTIDLEHLDTASVYSTRSAPLPRSREIPPYHLSSQSYSDVSVGRMCNSSTS